MRKNKQLNNNSTHGPSQSKSETKSKSNSIFSLERFVMNKQYSKRMFAQLIFCSLLVNSMASVVAIANTDVGFNQDDNTEEQTRCGKSNNCCNPKNSCCKPKHKDETFDFVVVGAGNTGCVIANRLSENGKYSVCVLEAGRDDARLSELLPEPSAANVPQPGDYHWGQYTRGSAAFTGELINRGFGDWWHYQHTDRPNGFDSTTYTRYSGWGGCTSHNFTIDIRNAPYNWNEWVTLGLTDWDASTPTSPLVKYYKKVENRSQAFFGTDVPFYDPGFPGEFAGFDPAWYGFDGMLPIAHGFPDDFTLALQGIVNTTLSHFGYPTDIVDLDYPPTAAQGGVSVLNNTITLQVLNATITEPGNAPTPGNFDNNVPFADYNFPLYGDTGFKAPQEYQDVYNPSVDPAALQSFQRTNAANTYLYAAENRPNLTIKSEVLVTNLIIKDKQAKGVEYLQGWNIYQTGRNPNTSQGGYGGTVGDARFNGVKAKKEGKCRVFARKAVVLCGGVYNTPQILMLSGIGNKFDLEPLGIKSILHLPGVGQHLIDNAELFFVWQLPDETFPSGNLNTLATFVNPTDSANGIPPAFDLIWLGSSVLNLNNETFDIFVQKQWCGLKNVPAIYSTNTRNTFHNILLDTVNPSANPGPITVISASEPIAPTPPETGPWAVTFTIPESILSEGGFTVRGNDNPNYNGKFTSTVFGNNVIDNSITLLYPTDPGVFGGGTTTITGDPAFLPIMVSPANMMGMLFEQEDNSLSEGYIKLQSCDPTVPPFIYMPYVSDPRDLEAFKNVLMQTGFPIMEELQYTQPAYFKNLLVPQPAEILFDGTDPFAPFSTANVDPEKLQTYLRNFVGGHHAGGTCKMGTANDPMAVVDQHGKVFGTTNLYVADMSVVPVSIRWPNGTCYVIGEKIAADILAAYA